MKKIWTILMYAAIAVTFAGCGSSSSSNGTPQGNEEPPPAETSGVFVKDTAGAAVAGAKVYAIPVADVEALAAVDITLDAGNYTATALTVDEPLEDLVNGNFAGVAAYTEENYIVTDEDGYAELPADAAEDEGKYFIYVQPVDETTHLPGGSLCREPVAIADLVGKVVEVSTKASAEATYVGTSKCLACHPEQEGMLKTAHKLGFMAPGAPSELQDPSEFAADRDDEYNMFAGLDKYEAGTTIWFYDYDGNRGFDDFKTLESDPRLDPEFTGTVYAALHTSMDAEGKYWVTFENIINPDDPLSNVLKKEIQLTYGGGVYKMRPLTVVGSSLYLLPLQYNATGDDASGDRTKKVWRDYHLEWWLEGGKITEGVPMTFTDTPPAIKSVDVQCASCHFTGFNLVKNADDTWTANGVVANGDNGEKRGEWNPAAQQYQELNVGCETCHGPGSEHVAAGGAGAAIVHPGNLTPEREMTICSQCHSRPKGNGFTNQNDCPLNQDDEMMRAGTSRADYLADYTVVHDSTGLWADGHSKKHHQQYTDFIQSSKYRNGTKLLTCSSCHDLHAPGTDRHQLSGTSDSSLCASCHTVDSGAHQEAMTGSSLHASGPAQCIQCHTAKISGSGAGINPTDPFVGASGTEYLHNDISSHVFDVPLRADLAEGDKMPIPYTNPCGACHFNNAGL